MSIYAANYIFLSIDFLLEGKVGSACIFIPILPRPPITCEELVAGTRPDSFTMLNIRERLTGLTADPWQEYFPIEQELLR